MGTVSTWIFSTGLPLLAALVGVAGLYLSWRTLPEKRLYFGMSNPVSLGITENLTLAYAGIELTSAHTVNLWLSSEGRHSIKSADFDNGMPIVLDLAPARILELLGSDSIPEGYSAPPVEIDGTMLKIGPGALRPRQLTTYSMIIDGIPFLSCQTALPDVRVEPWANKNSSKLRKISNFFFLRNRWTTLLAIWALLLFGLTSGVYRGIFYRERPTVSTYVTTIPAANEGTWMLQAPVRELPQLPSQLTDDCSAVLQRAVAAGAGVRVGTMQVDVTAYVTDADAVSFNRARLIIDERNERLNGDKVRCVAREISAEPIESRDRLLVNLDDQSVRHIPALEPTNESWRYTINVEVATTDCYCRYHLEVDLDVDNESRTVVIDDTSIGSDKSESAPRLVPFQLSGSGSGNLYDFRGGHWQGVAD